MVDDIRLNIEIEQGAKGGPGFKTTVITMSSGNEVRNQEWSIARGSWDIGYGIRKRADMEDVYAFFLARRGKARGFRFRDWLDFSGTGELTAAVVGDLTKRQIIKTYTDAISPYIREIKLPVIATVLVYVDNILVESGFTLDAGGIINFTADPGANVRATFEFDVPARFDTDSLAVQLNTYMEGAMLSSPVVELREL